MRRAIDIRTFPAGDRCRACLVHATAQHGMIHRASGLSRHGPEGLWCPQGAGHNATARLVRAPDVTLHTSTMPTSAEFPIEGGCDCRTIRYRLDAKPLFVHCCHCTWCQRESGAAFALNAMIESDRVVNLGAEPELVHTPSDSGLGQRIARCPRCRLAVWSHYAGAGPVLRFVRVGTLDNPGACPPDIHIFTQSKQPWVQLGGGVPAVAEYYDREDHWPPESLKRREALLPAIQAYQATLNPDA